MKWSSQKTIMFQVGIIKACSKQENSGIDELNKRITFLENKINQKQQTNNEIKIPEETKKTENKPQEKKTKEILIQNSTKNKEVPYWQNIVNTLKENGKIMLYTNLINSNAIQINDMTIGIQFAKGLTNFGKSVLERPENMQELVRLVSIEAGQEMKIKYLDSSTEKKEDKKGKISELDIPINIIEDE